VTKRIAISLPDTLYQRVERIRRSRRLPRSAVIQEALGAYVRTADETAMEEAYFDGYRRVPDGKDVDFAAIERAGIDDLRKAKLD
jgi:metal-responsive CopG/Arc/MetJ family transcriptional regulator